MKKLHAMLLTLLMILTCLPAAAESAILLTPVPPSIATPVLKLRPSADEVKAYASPNLKANIVGYIIVGGRQEVEILSIQDNWCYVSFTSIYGTSQGWIPLSCFEAVTTPQPTPTPTPEPAAQGSAFVCNPQAGYRLNLREEPSTNADSLGKYYSGTPVTLTGLNRNGFLQVTIGSVMGWMDSRYITVNPYAFLNEMPEVTVKNPGDGVNLRYGPGTAYRKLGKYSHGTTVTIMGVRADGWYHVAVGGQTGFMSSSLLSEVFPWQYGTDSDNPAVSGGISSAVSIMYVNNHSSTDRLHLRQQASYSAASLGRFYTGTPVTIVSYTRTGWAYVRIGSLEGYMDMSYLTASMPQQYGVTRMVNNTYGTGLNLRTLPTTSSAVLALCPNYTRITVLGDLSDGWCYVQYGDQMGYMMGTRLTTTGY
ncbi:MAG: SH3 domain-containing protein [Clostridia bacterium]|nr:SH3 domain-containing protein [Clostridia bacterium]